MHPKSVEKPKRKIIFRDFRILNALKWHDYDIAFTLHHSIYIISIIRRATHETIKCEIFFSRLRSLQAADYMNTLHFRLILCTEPNVAEMET